MSDSVLGQRAAEALEAIREKKPLIHNITNFVVMNYTANALLACGASPVMAHAPEEVEEMVAFAGALVLNIGTLSTSWVDAMLTAGRKANELEIPIILDPVGSGATRLRTESARRLMDELSLRVIRGNASEILSLARKGSRTKGVDSIHRVEEAEEAAITLAAELRTTLAITGPVDVVTDGGRVCNVLNGHQLMGYVTGAGCTATALIGAFLAVETDPVAAAACGLAYFGLAAEQAAVSASGPGSFQTALLDTLYRMDRDTLSREARITSARNL
ncbi:MAG: hydroxyethylthiazole kinase [Deltaproteobacteria bacterium]|nr:hydroxyethylthiazole kinase [Deltaproteobacteria bacterium]